MISAEIIKIRTDAIDPVDNQKMSPYEISEAKKAIRRLQTEPEKALLFGASLISSIRGITSVTV